MENNNEKLHFLKLTFKQYWNKKQYDKANEIMKKIKKLENEKD